MSVTALATMSAKRAAPAGGDAQSAKRARTPAADALEALLRFSAAELADAAAGAGLLESASRAAASLAEALAPKLREHRLATKTCATVEDGKGCGEEASQHIRTGETVGFHARWWEKVKE